MRATVDEFRLAEVYSDAQLVRHSRAHVARTREALFFLHMQLDGESVTRQHGREARLQPGNFTLADNSRPYEIHFGGPDSRQPEAPGCAGGKSKRVLSQSTQSAPRTHSE
jgi:hypothetical protein